ncbi:MAG: PAS domain-containing protein [Pseudolabrys sp.]|nr:PAS domain-containing protein [Pseudolabrys sp.]
MKHVSSKAVFAHWDSSRAGRPAPDRGDIDPMVIRHSLGDVFILAVDFVNEHRYRLAGTRLCTLFNRELKGESFAAAFDEESRVQITELLAAVADENAGVAGAVTARTADGSQADLELLLLPLAHQGHARVRALGVLAAGQAPYWAGEKPVKSLHLGAIRHVGPEVEKLSGRTFMTKAAAGLRRRFMVYQGGLEAGPGEKSI